MCQLVASASLIPWRWSHPAFPCPPGNRPQCPWWSPQHQSPSFSLHKGRRGERCSPGGASSVSPELCYFRSSRGDLGSVMDTIYSFPKQVSSFPFIKLQTAQFPPQSNPVCTLSFRTCSVLYLLFFCPWNRIIPIFILHWLFQWHLKGWKSPPWNGKFQNYLS